ncbi:MAG: 3'-5' exonuclease [Simkaniaceae bacterium]|nr:3'-5' exonuclease [Simkaniaceae bacterium]
MDTETNGLDFRKNRIIEICFIVFDLIKYEEIERYESLVFQSEEVWKDSDPDSLEVNGFNWDMIADAPGEAEVAEEIKEIFKRLNLVRKKAVFICQNPSFDRNFFSQMIPSREQDKMQWPYHWFDFASMFWALSLERKETLPWKVGFSKDKIAAYYGLPPEQMPHRAINGVLHLIDCYKAAIPKIDLPDNA